MTQEKLIKTILGNESDFSIERRCFNATSLSSTLITSGLFVVALLLGLSNEAKTATFIFSITFGCIYCLGRQKNERRWLVWAYLCSHLIILFIDWFALGGYTGVTLPATIALTCTLPLIMQPRQLKIGLAVMFSFIAIVFSLTIYTPETVPLHNQTVSHLIDRFISVVIIGSGLTILTFLVMHTYRRKSSQLQTTNQALSTTNRQLDISLIKQQQVAKEYQDNTMFLDTLFDAVPLPMFYKDNQKKYRKINKAFYQAIGLEKEDIINRTADDIFPEMDLSITDEFDRKVLETGFLYKYENTMKFSDGLLHHVLVSKNAHVQSDGTIDGIVGTVTDITERKIHEAKIQHLAHHDTLTDLHNRTYFYETLNRNSSKSARNKNTFSLLFIDLDGFKEINDTYGHHAGDITLQIIAGRIQQITRDYDTVCRLGGDEFAIILEDIDEHDHLTAIAEKILLTLSESIVFESYDCTVTCSMGIAVYPFDAKTVEELVKEADKAMYRAKAMGKNQFSFCSKTKGIRGDYVN